MIVSTTLESYNIVIAEMGGYGIFRNIKETDDQGQTKIRQSLVAVAETGVVASQRVLELLEAHEDGTNEP